MSQQSIKNFSIFKNKNKKQETHPDYTISAKVQKDNVDEYKEIGAVYLKETKTGEKFFSCSLSKPREVAGVNFSGYVVVDEERFEKMSKVYEDYLIQQRNPGYPTETTQGLDIDEMERIFKGEVSPENKVVITPEMLDVSPDDINF